MVSWPRAPRATYWALHLLVIRLSPWPEPEVLTDTSPHLTSTAAWRSRAWLCQGIRSPRMGEEGSCGVLAAPSFRSLQTTPCGPHPGLGRGTQVCPEVRRARKYISSSVRPELGSCCTVLFVKFTALFSSARKCPRLPGKGKMHVFPRRCCRAPHRRRPR